MKLRTLLLLSISVAVLVTVALAVWLSTVDSANRRNSELEQASQDVARTAAALQSLTMDYMQFGGSRAVQQWRVRHEELLRTLQKAQILDEESTYLKSMSVQAQALKEAFSELSTTVAGEDADVAGRRRGLLLERLLTASESFVDSRRAWAGELTASAERVDLKVSAALLGMPILLIAVIGAGGAMVWMTVLRPLQQLQQTAQRVESGDWSARADIRTRNEVGDVARAVDRMTNSLLQAQERMQLVLEHSPLGIFMRDMDRKLILASPSWYQIAGVPYTAGQDISIADVVHPDDLHVVLAKVEALLATGEGQHWEVRYLHADGRTIWVRTHLTPMRRGEEWLGVFGIVEDVTEHRELTLALGQRTETLRLVIDNVPALICQLDPAGRYVLANATYLRWVGKSLPDVVGRTVEEIRDATEYEAISPLLRQALAGSPASAELEFRRGDSIHAMQVTYMPKLDDQGQVVAVYGFKSDVSEVRSAEARLRLMINASPIGIFIRDLDGTLRYANAAWLRLFGQTFEEARAAKFVGLVHADYLERVTVAFRQAVAGQEVPTLQSRVLHRGNPGAWVQLNLRRFEGPGLSPGVLGLLEDISERHELDELLAQRTAALQRSNEDLESFAYVASHDLQEPLRMVNSYGQLLKRRFGATLEPKAQEFVTHMVDGGERAQELIRALLDLARLDSQSSPTAQVSMSKVLLEVLHRLRTALSSNGGTVTHDELPTVLGDERQLGQLMENLISNAVKYRGEDAPQVHVSAQRESDHWHFTVRDNGIGIAPQFFEKVFVMFQRLHLRSERPGTGIGLAICKRVVERHGGRIWLESTPGRGSAFHFTLSDKSGALEQTPAESYAGARSGLTPDMVRSREA